MLAAGTRVGPYEIVSGLGAGGNGASILVGGPSDRSADAP